MRVVAGGEKRKKKKCRTRVFLHPAQNVSASNEKKINLACFPRLPNS